MFPWPAAVHRLQIPAIRLQIPAMSTTDSGCYDYKFQLYRLQILAVIHRHSPGKEFFLSPESPFGRGINQNPPLSQRDRLQIPAMDSWCSPVFIRTCEHLVTNGADYLTTTNSGNSP